MFGVFSTSRVPADHTLGLPHHLVLTWILQSTESVVDMMAAENLKAELVRTEHSETNLVHQRKSEGLVQRQDRCQDSRVIRGCVVTKVANTDTKAFLRSNTKETQVQQMTQEHVKRRKCSAGGESHDPVDFRSQFFCHF